MTNTMPTDFKEYTLECTNTRDVRFTGKFLGEVETIDICKVRVRMYITLAGSYVCMKELIRVQEDTGSSSAAVCRNQEEVVDFFRDVMKQAKKLYKIVGFEDTIDVA